MRASSILAVFLCLIAVGCTTPSTAVRTVDTRPSIMISGAPADSLLLVDGMDMGSANQYDGKPKILIVESGTHKISIVQGDTVVFEKLIFVDSETKEIIVK